MKRILIFVVLLCVLSMVYSQDNYRKMFVPGRTWNIMSARGTRLTENDCFAGVKWDSTFTHYTINANIEDTVLEKIEKDRKVYANFDGKWLVQFDFNLQVGDYTVEGLRVESIDTIEVKGRTYRRFSFWPHYLYVYDDLAGFRKPKEYCWVEGIGCSFYGPRNGLYPVRVIDVSAIIDESVLSVYDGDELIFEEDDFMAPTVTAIRTVSRDIPDMPSSLFDLQGRRLTTQPKSGVYIREGKKYVVK